MKKKVILEDMDVSTIRTSFIKRFLGITTIKWLEEYEKELHVKKNEFDLVFNNFTKEYNQIKEIDKNNIKQEHMELLNNDTSHLEHTKQALDDYILFNEQKLDEFQEFCTKSRPLTENEQILVNILIANFKENIAQIQADLKTFNEKAKELSDFLKHLKMNLVK